MEDEQEGQEGSEIPIEDEGGDERSEGGWSDATTLVLGERNPEERDELDDSENEMPPLMNGGSPVASPASPGGGDGASENGSSESVVMSPKDTKNEWKEELFQTPPDLKGSLRRHELIEMCVDILWPSFFADYRRVIALEKSRGSMTGTRFGGDLRFLLPFTTFG